MKILRTKTYNKMVNKIAILERNIERLKSALTKQYTKCIDLELENDQLKQIIDELENDRDDLQQCINVSLNDDDFDIDDIINMVIANE